MFVLFVRPQDGANFSNSYNLKEALGIEYLCAVLEKSNIENDYIDFELFPEDFSDYTKILRDKKPDIIGCSINYPQVCDRLKPLLEETRKILPNAVILVGGQYATATTEKLLKNFKEIDIILRYEAENNIVDLIRAIEKKNLIDFPNIAYRNNGEIIINKTICATEHIDEIPFPTRLNKYIKRLKSLKLPVAILGSRGCWWGKCGYCTIGSSLSHNKWVGRSIENIIEEITIIKNVFDIKDFTFIDAEFLGPSNTSLARAKKLLNYIKKYNLNITFSVNLRPENITKEILDVLYDCGLKMIYIGIESYASAHIKRWNRGTSQASIARAASLLMYSKIPFRTGFIMFDPLSTLKDIEENISFLQKYPIIEPSLLIRGLEIRNGMPLKVKIDQLSQNKMLIDNYFVNQDVALLIRIIRNSIGKLLLFIHRIQGQQHEKTLKYETYAKIEKQTLVFLLQEIKYLLHLFEENLVIQDSFSDYDIQIKKKIDCFLTSLFMDLEV